MYSRSWAMSANLCNRKTNLFFHASCAHIVSAKAPEQQFTQRQLNSTTTSPPAQRNHHGITSATKSPAQRNHQHTAHCTLYTPQTLHTTLHTPHSTLHTLHSTLHHTLHSTHTTLLTPHSRLHTLQSTRHT